MSTALHRRIECLVFGCRTTKLNIFMKLDMFTLNYAVMNASGRDTKDTAKFATIFLLRISSTESNNEKHTKPESVVHQPKISRKTNNHKSATHQIQIMGQTKHKSSANQPHITRIQYPQLTDKPTTSLGQSNINSAKHQPQFSRTPTTIQPHTKHKTATHQPRISETPTTIQSHTNHKSAKHQA